MARMTKEEAAKIADKYIEREMLSDGELSPKTRNEVEKLRASIRSHQDRIEVLQEKLRRFGVKP